MSTSTVNSETNNKIKNRLIVDFCGHQTHLVGAAKGRTVRPETEDLFFGSWERDYGPPVLFCVLTSDRSMNRRETLNLGILYCSFKTIF